jgi:GT2 family glycosyltransferase/ADP-heptose:LPS heptosyltransferase
MKERTNIIRQNITRKSWNDKLKEALAKKPTASHLNTHGASPLQEQQLSVGMTPEKEKLLKDRLVRNAKNRKRFNQRPIKIKFDPIETKSYMDSLGSISGHYNEYPTPSWFRSEEPVDVSIIIPLYKSDSVIKDLIRTWPIESSKYTFEIIFIDDQCPKNSKEVVLDAWTLRKDEITKPIGKIIVNTTNKGYGQACNAGVEVASGKYLIFLNADTKVTSGWIDPMIDLFADSNIGLVGNMHLKEGGAHNETIDSAGSEWKWNDMSFVHIGRHCYRKEGISSPYKIENSPKDLLEVSEREMVTGCCFAMQSSLFNYIGGFNPNYKIGYWEDSEICLNVRELGYKIMFQPNSIIYHKLGHTSSGGHKYFTHNKDYFMNKWVKSHRLDDLLLTQARSKEESPVNRILIRRSSAHGDALVATGVCAGLRKKYPNAHIMFSTLFPEIICGNPNIDEFVDVRNINQTPFDVFYNLDFCYEWRPKINILTAYAELVGVKKEDCKLHMVPQNFDSLPDDFIVIHAGRTDWVGRDWPHENFIELSNRLIKAGEKVIAVGKYSEGQIPCTMDIRSKTSIAQMAFVMSKAKAFIGIDSLPMHIAQAFDVPGISFFGCVYPELRIFSKNMRGINAKNLSCLGCHHRKSVPSTVTKECETGTLNCIKNVSVDDMWYKTLDLLEEINNGSISLLG